MGALGAASASFFAIGLRFFSATGSAFDAFAAGAAIGLRLLFGFSSFSCTVKSRVLLKIETSSGLNSFFENWSSEMTYLRWNDGVKYPISSLSTAMISPFSIKKQFFMGYLCLPNSYYVQPKSKNQAIIKWHRRVLRSGIGSGGNGMGAHF